VIAIISQDYVPQDFVLQKLNSTTFRASWTPIQMNSGASLIGYRVLYRLRGTTTWSSSALDTDTFSVIDFTGSGNPSGNYEFTVFSRTRTNGQATNSNFSCRQVKGYNGSGNKADAFSSSGDLSSSIHIYPNPANDYVNIKVPVNSQIQLFDIRGNLILEMKAEHAETRISMDDIAKGIYMLRVTNADQSVSQKIVKE
jgi:hypothetical protein